MHATRSAGPAGLETHGSSVDRSLDDVLTEAVTVAAAALRVDACALFELSTSGDSLMLRAATGFLPQTLATTQIGVGRASHAGYALLAGEPVIVEDIGQETRFTEASLLVDQRFVSGLNVIVNGQGGPFGVLAAHSRRATTFTHVDVSILQGIANVLASVLHRNRVDIERNALAAAAKADAERESRTKSDFLAMLSHELRTPINSIAGYLQLMEMEIHGPLSDDQRDVVGRMKRNQQYLLMLVNNVLAFMKTGSGQLPFDITAVSVEATLKAVDELIRPQIEAKRVRFERCGPVGDVRVQADADKLQQVLLNLLSNAMKFTPTGGAVSVDFTSDASHVAIHVLDTGTGIPRDRLDSIFEPFVQVEPALTRTTEGTGLGLAISRQFVAAMSGTLSVHSVLGEGSVFTILLPRAG
jgi:signal transduction histidine kinase